MRKLVSCNLYSCIYLAVIHGELISRIKMICIYLFIEADYLTYSVSTLITIYYIYHLCTILSSDFQVTKNYNACLFFFYSKLQDHCEWPLGLPSRLNLLSTAINTTIKIYLEKT